MQERWQPSGGQPKGLVIHIQDLHTHPEAQHHLSELIGYLHGTLGIKLVALEGAEGLCNTSFFSAFPEPKIVQRISRLFVDEGLFAGSEDYAITHPGQVTLWGVEDAPVYLQHLQTYQQGTVQQAHGQQALTTLRKTIRAQVNTSYPRLLRRLLKLREAAYAEQSAEGAFSAYLDELLRFSQRSHLSLDAYPTIRAYERATRLHHTLDVRRIEEDRKQLLRILWPQLTTPERAQLRWLTTATKTGQGPAGRYEQMLAQLAQEHGIALRASTSDYGALRRYLTYLKRSEQSRSTTLIQEVESLQEVLEQTTFVTDQQRTLASLLRWTRLVSDLLAVKLTPEQLAAYQRYREIFTVESLWQQVNHVTKGQPPVTKEHLQQLIGSVSTPERFYELGLERNEILVRNTVKQLAQQKNPVAILIAGGFHTSGITQHLKANKLAYVVITPKVEGVFGEATYAARLQGQVPDPASVLAKVRASRSTLQTPLGTSELGVAQEVSYRDSAQQPHRLKRGLYLKRLFAAAYTSLTKPSRSDHSIGGVPRFTTSHRWFHWLAIGLVAFFINSCVSPIMTSMAPPSEQLRVVQLLQAGGLPQTVITSAPVRALIDQLIRNRTEHLVIAEILDRLHRRGDFETQLPAFKAILIDLEGWGMEDKSAIGEMLARALYPKRPLQDLHQRLATARPDVMNLIGRFSEGKLPRVLIRSYLGFAVGHLDFPRPLDIINRYASEIIQIEHFETPAVVGLINLLSYKSSQPKATALIEEPEETIKQALHHLIYAYQAFSERKAELQTTNEEVARAARVGTFRHTIVTVDGTGPQGKGSAVAVGDGRLLITNAHVVRGGSKEIAIKANPHFTKGESLGSATVVAVSEDKDLAWLSFTPQPGVQLKPLRVIPGADGQVATLVSGRGKTVSTGILASASSRRVLLGGESVPGDSGSPYLSKQGDDYVVIGVQALALPAPTGYMVDEKDFKESGMTKAVERLTTLFGYLRPSVKGLAPLLFIILGSVLAHVLVPMLGVASSGELAYAMHLNWLSVLGAWLGGTVWWIGQILVRLVRRGQPETSVPISVSSATEAGETTPVPQPTRLPTRAFVTNGVENANETTVPDHMREFVNALAHELPVAELPVFASRYLTGTALWQRELRRAIDVVHYVLRRSHLVREFMRHTDTLEELTTSPTAAVAYSAGAELWLRTLAQRPAYQVKTLIVIDGTVLGPLLRFHHSHLKRVILIHGEHSWIPRWARLTPEKLRAAVGPAVEVVEHPLPISHWVFDRPAEWQQVANLCVNELRGPNTKVERIGGRTVILRRVTTGMFGEAWEVDEVATSRLEEEFRGERRSDRPLVLDQGPPPRTSEAVTAIQEALRVLNAPELEIILYGSFAQEEQQSHSDLDIAFTTSLERFPNRIREFDHTIRHLLEERGFRFDALENQAVPLFPGNTLLTVEWVREARWSGAFFARNRFIWLVTAESSTRIDLDEEIGSARESGQESPDGVNRRGFLSFLAGLGASGLLHSVGAPLAEARQLLTEAVPPDIRALLNDLNHAKGSRRLRAAHALSQRQFAIPMHESVMRTLVRALDDSDARVRFEITALLATRNPQALRSGGEHARLWNPVLQALQRHQRDSDPRVRVIAETATTPTHPERHRTLPMQLAPGVRRAVIVRLFDALERPLVLQLLRDTADETPDEERYAFLTASLRFAARVPGGRQKAYAPIDFYSSAFIALAEQAEAFLKQEITRDKAALLHDIAEGPERTLETMNRWLAVLFVLQHRFRVLDAEGFQEVVRQVHANTRVDDEYDNVAASPLVGTRLVRQMSGVREFIGIIGHEIGHEVLDTRWPNLNPDRALHEWVGDAFMFSLLRALGLSPELESVYQQDLRSCSVQDLEQDAINFPFAHLVARLSWLRIDQALRAHGHVMDWTTILPSVLEQLRQKVSLDEEAVTGFTEFQHVVEAVLTDYLQAKGITMRRSLRPFPLQPTDPGILSRSYLQQMLQRAFRHALPALVLGIGTGLLTAALAGVSGGETAHGMLWKAGISPFGVWWLGGLGWWIWQQIKPALFSHETTVPSSVERGTTRRAFMGGAVAMLLTPLAHAVAAKRATAKDPVTALIEALRIPDEGQWGRAYHAGAYKAFGRSGAPSPETLSTLLRLAREDTDKTVRRRVFELLGSLTRPTETVFSTLSDALIHEEASRVWRSAYATCRVLMEQLTVSQQMEMTAAIARQPLGFSRVAPLLDVILPRLPVQQQQALLQHMVELAEAYLSEEMPKPQAYIAQQLLEPSQRLGKQRLLNYGIATLFVGHQYMSAWPPAILSQVSQRLCATTEIRENLDGGGTPNLQYDVSHLRSFENVEMLIGSLAHELLGHRYLFEVKQVSIFHAVMRVDSIHADRLAIHEFSASIAHLALMEALKRPRGPHLKKLLEDPKYCKVCAEGTHRDLITAETSHSAANQDHANG